MLYHCWELLLFLIVLGMMFGEDLLPKKLRDRLNKPAK